MSRLLCHVEWEGWICTRPLDHEPDEHRAEVSGHVFASWPVEPDVTARLARLTLLQLTLQRLREWFTR